MKFVDRVSVSVEAGDGGNGAVSFRHEKYVERGGPDGGDGGKGGDVIFKIDRNLNTLQGFRYKQKLRATNGEGGSKRKRHGKNGDDLIVKVPKGTVVVHEGKTLVDLTHEDQEEIVALGGDGGYGNAHFKSSVRRAPRVAEKGEAGEKFEVDLELKLLADVGLVGLPNAGKSTFLSVVSNARPEIADYPFTTLSPNLGVVDMGKESILFADIPGLIEGASEGKGLGDEFLRHIERTSVILHLIDAYCDNVVTSYETIQKELKNYKVDLSKKPQVVAITKIEGMDDELVKDLVTQLNNVVPTKTKVYSISSIGNLGLKELLKELNKHVLTAKQKAKKKEAEEDEGLPVITLEDDGQAWRVVKEKKGYRISGKKIEKFARRTDFANEYGVHRLRNIMKKMGIHHELNRLGAKHGDKLSFKGISEEIEF